eukprot:337693-Prymnesium_polylepis.1
MAPCAAAAAAANAAAANAANANAASDCRRRRATAARLASEHTSDLALAQRVPWYDVAIACMKAPLDLSKRRRVPPRPRPPRASSAVAPSSSRCHARARPSTSGGS